MITKHEQNMILLEEWKQKQAEAEYLHRQRVKAAKKTRLNYESIERGYENEIIRNP